MKSAAITGVGYSAFSKSSGRSVLDLALEACRGAVTDAGISADEVDGVISFSVMQDSVPCQAVATGLALDDARLLLDVDLGGQAPCYLVSLAAMAVESGRARNVLVFRAMNGRSGKKVGSMEFPGPAGQYRYPIGFNSYMMYVAMFASRFLHETGQSERDLAAVALAQRKYAQLNPRAYLTSALDLESYMASPLIVEPFRRDDCTVEVDGACAVLVTSNEEARDHAVPPAVVASSVYVAGSRPGLDIGDHLLWPDYTRNYTNHLRAELFGRAGLGPQDIDFAEVYDCFTSTVLMSLEGLGFCARGESGQQVEAGWTLREGGLPTNTHGGLLSEGYLHGMNTVAEAVLQVQGRSGVRQLQRHETCVVTSGALMDGSAMVLAADRG